MTFGSTFGRVLSPTFQPSSQAAAGGGWWDLNGTITSCVGAWQPKGAASYAASKVNLTGDTDIYMTDGTTNYPTWNTSTGWTFVSAGYCMLTFTGVAVPKDQSWSFIARYANQGDGSVGGLITNNANTGYLIIINPRRRTVDTTRYCYGVSSENKGAYSSSGVIALAGRQPYFDGSTDGTALAEYSTTGTSVLTMGNLYDSAENQGWNGDLIAVAVYNDVLTSTQVSNLTTAMAAL